MERDCELPPFGVTLIDVFPQRLWSDQDLVVRFLGYVRTHFREIVPGVPSRCQVHLFAGRTAHNGTQLLPLLGLFIPPGSVEETPDSATMIELVESWMAALSDDEMRALAEATPGPTWDELQHRKP